MSTSKTRLAALAAAVSVGAALPAPAAEPDDPARIRQELRLLAAVLDQAVEAVSAPNPGFVLAGAPHSRGYLLKGTGVVVVVPPRRFPVRRSALVRRVRPSERNPGAREWSDRVVVMRNERDPGLRDLEAQVEAFQLEADRQRAEAERAFQEMTRRLFERLAAAEAAAKAAGMASGAPVPPPAWAPEAQAPEPSPVHEVRAVSSPPAPATPAPPRPASAPETPRPAPAPEAPMPPAAPAAPLPPLPVVPGAPWFFWGGEEFSDPEPRAPERLLTEVREAVVSALESYGPGLTSVRGDETISVVVDFVAGTPFLDENARPARSLTIRVRKRDLDDRRSGRLDPEELRRRVEAAEY